MTAISRASLCAAPTIALCLTLASPLLAREEVPAPAPDPDGVEVTSALRIETLVRPTAAIPVGSGSDLFATGPHFGGEIGFRVPLAALGLRLEGGVLGVDDDDVMELHDSSSLFSVGFHPQFRPIDDGPIDLQVGAKLAYLRGDDLFDAFTFGPTAALYVRIPTPGFDGSIMLGPTVEYTWIPHVFDCRRGALCGRIEGTSMLQVGASLGVSFGL